MEAAAKEERLNDIMALVERGFKCRVYVENAAPSDIRGHRLMERYVVDLPGCEWHEDLWGLCRVKGCAV